MASPSEPGWVTLARLVKTQGHRGEIAADLLTDLPDRFAGLARASLLHPSGRRLDVTLAGHWFHKGRVVLNFAEISDMNAAETWIGADLQVAASERPAPPPGTYFIDDLAGCEVYDEGQPIGVVRAVESVPGAAPLLHVMDARQREILIPFVAAFLDSVSLPDRRINMRLPSGLANINS